MEELLHEAGVSIVSGALTTVGASVFLLFAKIVFFMQFGLFILFTVGFSVIYSLGMFVILLVLIGPEDDRYSVSKWIRRMKSKAKKTALKYLREENDDEKLQLVTSHSTNALLGHESHEPTKDEVYKLSNAADGQRPGQIFSTSSSSTLTSLPKTKQSIDDDNVSSGYESNSVALTRFDAFYNSGRAPRSEEAESPSSSSNSEDIPASSIAWASGDQPPRIVPTGLRSRAADTSTAKRRGSRVSSAHTSRNGGLVKSASRKVTPVDALATATKSMSVTDIAEDRSGSVVVKSF